MTANQRAALGLAFVAAVLVAGTAAGLWLKHMEAIQQTNAAAVQASEAKAAALKNCITQAEIPTTIAGEYGGPAQQAAAASQAQAAIAACVVGYGSQKR